MAEQSPAAETADAQEFRENRGTYRVQRMFVARLRGRRDDVLKALVLNISRTGGLVAITDPRWEAASGDADIDIMALRLTGEFADGLEIELLESELVFPAEVVRIDKGRLDNRTFWQLGCRFLEDLDDDVWAYLGMPVNVPAAEAPAVPSVTLPEGVRGQAVTGPVVVVAGDAKIQALKERHKQKAARVRLVPGGEPVSVHDLLGRVVERKASDLHIKGKSPVRMRVDGKLVEISQRPLDSEEVVACAREILTPEQMERFENENDLDLAYALEDQSRFRINVLRAKGEIGMAIRRIPIEVPSPQELGIAEVCLTMADRPRGLILVTGPTGSGKSTTLAAMIHHINTTRPCHIVTMEDPIEYIHPERKAHVTQREVGRDTKDFASALRRALRQDPDVILVGEMRDLETIALAVTAAETGHLVLATLHTTSAPLTVDRIVDVFPPAQQRQIRMQLADSLQAIFSQVLVPKISGGVTVAQEILVANSGVRALVREGKAHQIGNMMQTGGKLGMQTLEEALNRLLEKRLVALDTALAKANHPEQIKDPSADKAGGL